MKIFANAALHVEGSPVTDNTITVDEAVEKFYQAGRNKLAHGEMPGLLEAWLQNYRSIGTRYEVKLANYLGFVHLVMMKILFRHF